MIDRKNTGKKETKNIMRKNVALKYVIMTCLLASLLCGLLAGCGQKGGESAQAPEEAVTLHVGAGTFKPVSTVTIGQHAMHSETIIVRKSLIQNLIAQLGKPIIPVGTTSTRTLESLYWIGMMLHEQGMVMRPLHVEQWFPYEEHKPLSTTEALQLVLDYLECHSLTRLEASTALMIAPSYKMRIITGLITNFHQPKSTLLLLVSALIGERWEDCYRFALDHGFRFLSYGDSCLFLP